MMIVTCPACGGSGDALDTVDLPHAPPCEVCGGRGEIQTVNLSDSVALVSVSHTGSDLLTLGYVADRMHAAKSFMEGWEARHEDCSMSCGGSASARYADVRDYLRGSFDTDPIVAALVALWLTREDLVMNTNNGAYWLSFHPSFYEAEV